MEKQGIIFKRLRETNGLSIREAAQKIKKCAGWLSEIENGRGHSVLKPRDHQKLMQLYNGDKYRKNFGAWVKADLQKEQIQSVKFDGAVYKYLRVKKAKMNLKTASQVLGISISFLSKIENSERVPTPQLKAQIMKLYGYSVESFKNFTTADKRAKNIPPKYKLQILINSLTEDEATKLG